MLKQKFFNNIATDSMVEMFYSLPLEFTPGATWSYSNTGYYLLGKIAEKVMNRNFFEYVRDSVHSPLNMQHTMANELAAKQGCLAKGYLMSKDSLKHSFLCAYEQYCFFCRCMGNNRCGYDQLYESSSKESYVVG